MRSRHKYLITGASGFIGGWLAETLVLQGAQDIKAGIRNWSSAVRLSRFPVNIVLFDVLDTVQIANAVRDGEIIIHCASGSEEIIIQGTHNMLDSAYRSGARRFVYLSTAEVYGNQTGNIDESCPLQDSGNPYARAKIEAERICWQFGLKGLPITIIRPSIVYGPFGKDWTVRLAERLQSGDWGVFQGIGEGTCNLIYVSDLVSGILLAAHASEAVGEAFNMVGPDILTWNQYFQKYSAALGYPDLPLISQHKARLHASLMSPFRASAKLVKTHFEAPLKEFAQKYRPAKSLMKSVETKMKFVPRPMEFSLFSRKAIYRSTKAREMLGFRPEFNIDSGLKLTVGWLDLHGLSGKFNLEEGAK